MSKLVRDWCRHYPYGNVEPGHVCDAKIVLVGEGPGREEIQKGRPFVGEAGRLLFGNHHLFPAGLLPSVGLSRDDCYITNILPFRPPGNHFDKVDADVVQRGIDALRRRLLARTNPNVIVVAGSHPLFAVANKYGIMKWRGSILSTPFGKCIGVIHPAAVLRQWALLKTCVCDWEKIKRESDFREVRRPVRQLLSILPSDQRLLNLLRAEYLSVDIETDRDEHNILCIGFAESARSGFSVDCRRGIPEIVKRLLACPAAKIFQKGMFDNFVLIQKFKLGINNWLHDTSTMFHALDNNVGPQTEAEVDETVGGKATIKPYSLAYMASVLTDEPYWKDDAKDEGTGERYGAWRNRWHEFQIYNARDAAVTYEIFEVCRQRLVESGRWDWYIENYSTLLAPLLDLSLTGVKFDAVRAKRQAKQCRDEQDDLRKGLAVYEPRFFLRHIFKKEPKTTGLRKDGIVQIDDGTFGQAGNWIKLGKTVSTQELKNFLTTKLKLKIKRGGDETADEVMLRSLLIEVKENEKLWKNQKYTASQAQDILSSTLRFRQLDSMLRFLQAKSVDSDGRVRSEYSLLIQTGRLSASKNALGSGMNLQNQKRNIRHLYLPDRPDWFLLSLDYKQAEDLVVKALTADPRAIELIRGVQNGTIDIHTRLAARVFNSAEELIDYAKRYVSKRTRHARNFDMQDKRFQMVLLKDGYVFTLAECARILAAVDEAEPWVPEWHLALRKIVRTHKMLVTPFGWKLDFEYERLRDSFTYRRGYAFIPQSTVGVAMKLWGLKYMHTWLREHEMQSVINMLVHDELVFSCPRDELYPIAKACSKNLEQPILVKNRWKLGDDEGAFALSIPTDITIGRHLKCICDDCKHEKPGMLTFPKLPTKKEFYERFDEWCAVSA